ncbi:hypothetical protein [Gracilinema caldarium]|uniref:Uncharacterized protein n=1 Tax=Gracilinema caldarium (strain ATCC 51460 / DSM 7334 / H1) TaxID=744872 RepID=F8EXC7_GRAC1|nr:hypothetical protein [Gracilinema caldarium]AEJ19154.1 hypothetical protein Spica_1004 [Gracilinema caldarium DSM 7334]
MKKNVVGLFSSIILLTSCWHPPFDPDVSASVLSARKLGDPVLEFKVSLPYEARYGYFIPCKSSYTQGGWITKEAYSLRISYVTFDPIFKTGVILNKEQLNGFSFAGLQVFPHPNDLQALYISHPDIKGWVRIDSTGFESYQTTDDLFLGAGATLTWSGTEEVGILYIASYGDGEQITLTRHDMTSSNEVYYPLPPQLPAAPIFAAKNDYGAYLSGTLTDGTPVTYYWFEEEGPVQLPLGRAMTGLLSDGRLLADTGDRLYIYDKDGNECFAIATGSLKFSFERYDAVNSRWVSVFTRTLQIAASNNDEWDYLISIYEIPTADLEKLKL